MRFVVCSFISKFFENFFQEYHQYVKQFGSRSGLTYVRPDLSPNCSQMSSADDTSEHGVGVGLVFGKLN